MPSFDPVIAVVRALQVLRTVNAYGAASIKNIHQDTGLHRSTVLRLLETLSHEGYVIRDPDSALYLPTAKTLLLSNGYQVGVQIASLARPFLDDLRSRIGWPSDVAIPDGTALTVVCTNRNFNVSALDIKLGARAPLLLSSLGRAYLAFCSDSRRANLLDGLAVPNEERQAVEDLLAEIRRRGFATPDPGFNRVTNAGMATGFSVPVFKDDEVFASLSVTFLYQTITLEEGVERLLPQLRDTAAALGEAIHQAYA